MSQSKDLSTRNSLCFILFQRQLYLVSTLVDILKISLYSSHFQPGSQNQADELESFRRELKNVSVDISQQALADTFAF